MLFLWLERALVAQLQHSPSSIKKKLTKVTKLVDIVTSAISVFETSLSKALNNGGIDEREFQVLQEIHLKVINELANINGKMELETRNQLQKGLLEVINEKKPLRTRDAL